MFRASFMPIIRRSDCVPLPIVVCPVVAVVMLESRVARCVHCVENVAWLCQATFSTFCHPTLQHHNSYNRTDNYRQWNAVGSPDDGHKDARNMLKYYWLPINHYLLHLVGFSFTHLNLGSFAKLQKANIGFIMSVSVSMEEPGSNWTDFYKILCMSIFRTSVDKFQVSLTSATNSGYFT